MFNNFSYYLLLYADDYVSLQSELNQFAHAEHIRNFQSFMWRMAGHIPPGFSWIGQSLTLLKEATDLGAWVLGSAGGYSSGRVAKGCLSR